MSVPQSKFVSAVEPTSVVAGSISEEMMGISNLESIFYILSESLYTDPTYSAITEILANAWDSHIVSGCTDKPIHLLIDMTNDSITITDNGGGIPHDKFMELYGNLGGTSKANNFDTTGGMGIGKLAPLSLTDSFIVVNSHNGISRTYALSKGSVETSGRHSVVLLLETEAEKEGMSITYTDPKFQHNWYHEFVTNTLPYLDMKVNVTLSNGSDIKKVKINNSFEHHDQNFTHYFRPGKNHYQQLDGSKRFFALLGNCLFNISKLITIPEDVCIFVENNNLDVVFKVPQGVMLNFTPNRETLIDTEHNRDVLNKLMSGYELWFKENTDTFVNNWFNLIFKKRDFVNFSLLRNLQNYSNSFETEDIGQPISFERLLTEAVHNEGYIRKEHFDECTQRSLHHNLRNYLTTLNGGSSNKKIRKVLTFLRTFNIDGSNVRPRVSMNYRYTRERFYTYLCEHIVIGGTVNIIPASSPKYVEKTGEINLYINQSTCREELEKGFKKLNPNINVVVKESLSQPTKKISSNNKVKKVSSNPRKRFITVADHIKSEEDENFEPNLIMGTKVYITSSELKYLLLLSKAPKEIKDKLTAYLNSKSSSFSFDYIKLFNLDPELLSNITLVRGKELEKYSKRMSTRMITPSRVFADFMFTEFRNDFTGIFNMYSLKNTVINNKTNNIYHYLTLKHPRFFSKYPNHILEFYQSISGVLREHYTYNYQKVAQLYLDNDDIFEVLKKLSDTPQFTPTLNALIKLGHIQ